MRLLFTCYILLNSLSVFAQSPPPANDSVVWFPEIFEHAIKWHPIYKKKVATSTGDTVFNWRLDTVPMATRARRIKDWDSIAPAKNTTNAYERFTGKPVTHNFNCGSSWEYSPQGEFLKGFDNVCCMCRPKPKSKKCVINKTKDYYIRLGDICKKCEREYGDVGIIVHSGDSRMKNSKKTNAGK